MKEATRVVSTFGWMVRLQTSFDLTGYTNLYIRFRKPGTAVWIEKTAAVYGADVDGVLEYETVTADVASFLDTVGELRITGRFVDADRDLVSDKPAKLMLVKEGMI